jgi:hypothetical protein
MERALMEGALMEGVQCRMLRIRVQCRLQERQPQECVHHHRNQESNLAGNVTQAAPLSKHLRCSC